jgi:1-acyl-sn-glycerol-3-phosphate acyltransferase
MRVTRTGGGPVFPDDGPAGPRLIRRLRGITLEVVAFVLVTVLLPALLVVAAAVDLVLWLRRRKPCVGVRLAAFLWWFLAGELRALLVILGIWLRSGGPFGGDSERRQLGVYNLRISWARGHLAGIRVLFRLRFEVEDLELAGPGPVLIFIRHASIIDNMLPDTLVAHGHGIGLRYVVKRELQMIPVIDIGGRWIPTNFVRRGSGDAAAEVERLRLLARNMSPGEGILIYPEGTRFTTAKLARANERIAQGQPEIAPLAGRLRNLLPPRLGGPLAMLEDTRGTDVVFCVHVGFDGYESVGDIWRGTLVGTVIRVKFWRVAAKDVPTGEDERVAWLYDHWQRLDDWVGEHRAGEPPAEHDIDPARAVG